ncbi:unnamed protein product [Clonostachys rosea]|uniref:LDB19 N-terminal domain-containing protein n=1 Tax=Bionectria ochroleuca TaxID=29856 RepID=A0ABY6UCP0_BIOOC|nr:unnamed protein product [Clonostachys rosea]
MPPVLRYLTRGLELISGPPAAATLRWNLENAWIILMENGNFCPPVAVRGNLIVDVHADAVKVVDLKLDLILRLEARCHRNYECLEVEIGKWSNSPLPLRLPQGIHNFPFSIPIPGGHPGTTDTPDLLVRYSLTTTLRVCRTTIEGRDHFDTLRLGQPIIVKRLIASARAPTYYHETLPEINATFSAIFSNIAKPLVDNKVSIRLESLPSSDETGSRYHFRRLKKVEWRLNEITSYKTSATGIDSTTTRRIADSSLCQGWKPNLRGGVEMLDFDFIYKIHELERYSCGVKMFQGVQVKHALVIKMYLSMAVPSIGDHTLTAMPAVDRKQWEPDGDRYWTPAEL